jgi:hypothetical protein
LALGACLFATLSSPAAEKFSNTDCLDCHLDPATTRKVDGKTIALIFPTNAFQKSVHAKLECVDCHTGIKDLVHPSKLPPPNCVGCHDAKPTHEQTAKEYASSIHGVSHTLGASGAASCWSCHGSHGMLPVKHADSPVFKLNLPRTCAACHSNPGLTKEYQMKYPKAASQYHGQHPWPRVVENGFDCRAFLQRLPWRARYQARRRSRTRLSITPTWQDLRQMSRDN